MVVVNLSDDQLILDGLAGRVLIGTDRDRDHEPFASPLRVRAWEGFVAELR